MTAREGVSAEDIDVMLSRAGIDARAERIGADLEDVFVQLIGGRE
jgi:hypothetical protein